MRINSKVAGGAATAKRAYWDKQLSEWERSGQAQRVFCAQRGLKWSPISRQRFKLCAVTG